MTVGVEYCEGRAPDCGCALMVYTYRRVCNFGLLPAGSYTFVFTERHDSPYDPIQTFSQSAELTVRDVTATVRRTWGAVKSFYR